MASKSSGRLATFFFQRQVLRVGVWAYEPVATIKQSKQGVHWRS